MLAAIAKAYDQGRLLLIGTSDIDAQQPVIWNIGAIAKKQPSARAGHRPAHPARLRRHPGAFPPSMFQVTVDGQPYQEMHVDGGAFMQTFLYPAALTHQRRQRMAKGGTVVPAVAYVIRNGRRLDPDWAATRRRRSASRSAPSTR